MNKTRSLVIGLGIVLSQCLMVYGQAVSPAASPATTPPATTQPATTQPRTYTVLVEAETFNAGHGAKRIKWGENYYKANFANAALSRQAGLQMVLNEKPVKANKGADQKLFVPAKGNYRLLIRYEAPHLFDAGFSVQLSQNGKTVLLSVFGAPDRDKLWPFGIGLAKDNRWTWGANENVVWEGHADAIQLEQGEAHLHIEPTRTSDLTQAMRNIDCVLLTSDLDGLNTRIEKETFLPMGSWLTQSGDLWARVVNKNQTAGLRVNFASPAQLAPGEKREPRTMEVPAGETSGWIEVGSLLPTFYAGRWSIQAGPLKPGKGSDPDFVLEFGTPGPGGPTANRSFEVKGRQLELAYEPNLVDVGLERGLRPLRQVLFDLLAELEKEPAPPGKPPVLVPVGANTFARRTNDPEYNAAIERFVKLIGLNETNLGSLAPSPNPRVLSSDVGVSLARKNAEQIRQQLTEMKEKDQLGRVAYFLLGTETMNNLIKGPSDDHEGFREFLQEMGVTASEASSGAGEEWEKVFYTPDLADELPEQTRFYNRLYEQELRIREVMKIADVIREFVPDAKIAINFNSYMTDGERGATGIGPTYSFAQTYRRKALTFPWTQDYTFWMPLGWQGEVFGNIDLMRAGIRHYDKKPMRAYVMPQSPGNNPRNFRRMFYGHMAHGINEFDLFAFQPIHTGNARYHITDTRMYNEVRKVTHELGSFEDVLANGKLAAAHTAIYHSQTGDIAGTWQAPYAAAKRAMYSGLKLTNVPLDAVIEEDVLDGTLNKYKALIICDRKVSPAAWEKITQWVNAGGLLIVSPAALEHLPTEQQEQLLKCRLESQACKGWPEPLTEGEAKQRNAPLGTGVFAGYRTLEFLKQDLMNLPAMDVSTPVAVKAPDKEAGKNTDTDQPPITAPTDVFYWRASLEALPGGEVAATYKDGRPSIVVTRRADGRPRTITYGFTPGLQGFKSDTPIGRTEDFESVDYKTIGEMVDPSIVAIVNTLTRQHANRPRAMVIPVGHTVGDLWKPGEMIQTGMIESDKGVVVPIIDWGNKPGPRQVTLSLSGLGEPNAFDWFDHLGQPLKVRDSKVGAYVTLTVDGAGALVLRRK